MNEASEPAEARAPQTLYEHVVANSRPQPAIPAVLMFFLMVLIPLQTIQAQPGQLEGWLPWLIGAGLVLSCALAVAAGFCSFAPQLLWLLLAVWAHSLIDNIPNASTLNLLLWIGVFAAAAMLVVQLWRVRTLRFVPTISDPVDEDY